MRSPKSVEGMWQGRMTGPRSSGMDNDEIHKDKQIVPI